MPVDLLLGTLRYAVGLTLGLAAVWKVKDFGAFRASLTAYGLGGHLGRIGAAFVVAAEALTAVLSFAPVADLVVGSLAASLGVVFLASQIHVLATGKRASCLCFGKAGAEPVSGRTVARAGLVFLAGFLVLIAGTNTARHVDPLACALALALLVIVGSGVRRWKPAGR